MEGQHSGYSTDEEADEFDMTLLGPTGVFEVYHASPFQIEKFKPFTHFGTLEAAMHRARDLNIIGRGFLHKVKIDVTKSVEILDSGFDQHNLEGMITYLETMLALDYHEVESVLRAPVKAAKLLARYGYDTLYYKNRREDAGSDSWVCMQPKKIQIIETVRI